MTDVRHRTRRMTGPLIAVLVLMTAAGAWLVPATAAPAAPTGATPTFSPTSAPFPPSISDRIDAGSSHTCVVDDDEAVRCWGLNSVGQLGHGGNGIPSKIRIGDNETPASAGTVDLGGTSALRVSAGANHTCAVLVGATVACWGHNTNGILGSGEQSADIPGIGDDEVPGTTRVDLGTDRTAKAIAAGGDHTCVITDQDQVMCWGNGGSGELGYGNEDDIGDDEVPATAGPVNLGNGRSARSIVAGLQHTCALMDNGNVFCWGDNDHGQLGRPGNDDVGDDETPADVGTVDLGAMKALSLTAGDDHTCARLDNHKLRCWGRGLYGAIGSGTGVQPPSTGHVDLGGVDITQGGAGAGSDHTCAVLSGAVHDVRCWGRGTQGRLGLLGLGPVDDVGDDESPAAYPTVDLAGDSITAVTAGQMHTCAVTTGGRVRCWGNNSEGAVGHGFGEYDIGDDEAPGSIDPIVLGARVTCGIVITCV